MEKSNLRLNISEDDSSWQTLVPDIQNKCEEILQAVFAYVFAHGELFDMDFSKQINVNLCLSGDDTVRELNKTYRGLDKPTNVLSFARLDDDDFAEESALFSEIDLGDIIISRETLEREAAEKNISFVNHFAHLFVHGLLHILGFDHQSDEEAEHMEHFETEILAGLNIPNPYQD